MKKRNILKILLFIVAIVFMPKKVFAASCDLVAHAGNANLEGGTYNCTISEDLEVNHPFVISEGTITISLDHNITSTSSPLFEVQGDANLILTGTETATVTAVSGTIVNFRSTGNLTVEGGNYVAPYIFSIDTTSGNVVIEDGNFNGSTNAVNVLKANSFTIEDGIFNSQTNGALFVLGSNELTINGGTFTGGFAGAQLYSVSHLRINGGAFTGEKFGIYLGSIENLASSSNAKLETEGVLLGGTFNSTGNNSYAIGIDSIEGDNDIFNTLVGNSHHYSNKFKALRKDIEDIGSGSEGTGVNTNTDSTKYYLYVSDIKNVSVVDGAPTAAQKIDAVVVPKEDNNTEVANPKTGSMLYIYVIAFMLVCGVAVFGTYSYRKKLNK